MRDPTQCDTILDPLTAISLHRTHNGNNHLWNLLFYSLLSVVLLYFFFFTVYSLFYTRMKIYLNGNVYCNKICFAIVLCISKPIKFKSSRVQSWFLLLLLLPLLVFIVFRCLLLMLPWPTTISIYRQSRWGFLKIVHYVCLFYKVH